MAVTKVSNLPILTDSIIRNNVNREYDPTTGIFLNKFDLAEMSIRNTQPVGAVFPWYSASIPYSDLLFNMAGKIFRAPADSLQLSPFSYNPDQRVNYKPGDRIFYIPSSDNATKGPSIKIIKATDLITTATNVVPNDVPEDGEITISTDPDTTPWVYDSDIFERNPVPVFMPVFSPIKIFHSSWRESTDDFTSISQKDTPGAYQVLAQTFADEMSEKGNFTNLLPKTSIGPATKTNDIYPLSTINTGTSQINPFSSGLSATLAFKLTNGSDPINARVTATESMRISYLRATGSDKLYYESSPWGPFCYQRQLKNDIEVDIGTPWSVVAGINSNLQNTIENVSSGVNISTALSARQPTLTLAFDAGSALGHVYEIYITGTDKSHTFSRISNGNSIGSSLSGISKAFTARVSTSNNPDGQVIAVNPGETVKVGGDSWLNTYNGTADTRVTITITGFQDQADNALISSYSNVFPVASIAGIKIVRTPTLADVNNWTYATGKNSRNLTVVNTEGTAPNAVTQILKSLATEYSATAARPIFPYFVMTKGEADDASLDSYGYILPYFPSVEALKGSIEKGVVHESLPDVTGKLPAGSTNNYAQFNTNGAFSLGTENLESQTIATNPVLNSTQIYNVNQPPVYFAASKSSGIYGEGSAVQPTTLNGYLYFYVGNTLDSNEDPAYSTTYLKDMIRMREFELSSETLKIFRYERASDGSLLDPDNPNAPLSSDFGITNIELGLSEDSVLEFDDEKNLQLKIGQGLKQTDKGTVNNRIEFDTEARNDLMAASWTGTDSTGATVHGNSWGMLSAIPNFYETNPPMFVNQWGYSASSIIKNIKFDRLKTDYLDENCSPDWMDRNSQGSLYAVDMDMKWAYTKSDDTIEYGETFVREGCGIAPIVGTPVWDGVTYLYKNPSNGYWTIDNWPNGAANSYHLIYNLGYLLADDASTRNQSQERFVNFVFSIAPPGPSNYRKIIGAPVSSLVANGWTGGRIQIRGTIKIPHKSVSPSKEGCPELTRLIIYDFRTGALLATYYGTLGQFKEANSWMSSFSNLNNAESVYDILSQIKLQGTGQTWYSRYFFYPELFFFFRLLPNVSTIYANGIYNRMNETEYAILNASNSLTNRINFVSGGVDSNTSRITQLTNKVSDLSALVGQANAILEATLYHPTRVDWP